jgi:hypothetical protein
MKYFERKKEKMLKFKMHEKTKPVLPRLLRLKFFKEALSTILTKKIICFGNW